MLKIRSLDALVLVVIALIVVVVYKGRGDAIIHLLVAIMYLLLRVVLRLDDYSSKISRRSSGE